MFAWCLLDRVNGVLVASGRDRPSQDGDTGPLTDPETEQRRMDFEERKGAEELKLENDKLAAQTAQTRLES